MYKGTISNVGKENLGMRGRENEDNTTHGSGLKSYQQIFIKFWIMKMVEKEKVILVYHYLGRKGNSVI